MESYGEYMDIEVVSMPSAKQMKNDLNQVMVEGMEILSVTPLPDRAKNAMASVAAASYRLQMKEGVFPVDDLNGKIQAFYGQETIPYTKETKRSVVDLDLKQGIYEIHADTDETIQMLVTPAKKAHQALHGA